MAFLLPLLLAIGASWRVARLLTVDQIAQPFRDRVVARAGLASNWAYLVTCPWCMSIWTSPPIVAAAVVWPTNRVVLVALASLTASLVAGLGQSIEDRLDR